MWLLHLLQLQTRVQAQGLLLPQAGAAAAAAAALNSRADCKGRRA